MTTTPNTSITPPAGTVSAEPPSKIIDPALLKELTANIEANVRESLREEMRKDFLNDGQDREQVEGSVPFGTFSQKLDVFGPDVDRADPLPGFHLHWINDEGDRVMRHQMKGYDFVKREELALNAAITPLNKDMGDYISCYVGSTTQGTPMRAYLMKISNEKYKKYRGQEQAYNDKIDEAIRRGVLGQTTNDKRYIADQGRGISFSSPSGRPPASR